MEGAERPAELPNSSTTPVGGKAPVEVNTIPPRPIRTSTPPGVSVSEAGADTSRTTLEIPTVSVLSAERLRLGGRLQCFWEAWTAVTSDASVLQSVRGFHIEFYDVPCQPRPPHPIVFSAPDAQLVDAEVAELLQKGAICRTTLHERGFLSNLFLVDKPDGERRPVINLKEFNGWLIYLHFKMEGIHLLRDVLLPGDWLVRLDLKNAYLVVPIHPPHRWFLQFLWRGQVFEFTALPFGLASAPWCFTKILHPVVEVLRSQGFRLIVYLDDILLMAQCPLQLAPQLQSAVSLLESLGFVVNGQKSILCPTRKLVFLGFVIDSVQATLSLPSRKLAKIRHVLRRTMSKSHSSLRQIARLVGLLSSSIQAIFPGPLHYRAM